MNAVDRLPRLLLHAEGLALFVGAIALYAYARGSTVMFLVLLLAPDLSMIGYMVNSRVGSRVYNLAHFMALPMLLAVVSLLGGWLLGIQLALIWLVHIGMDRSVGYGLKYDTAFKDTHLQHV